jgi:DNA-binding NarL/FixJ family response regulator
MRSFMETRKGTVLVVDGETAARKLAVRALERGGYTVRGIASGEEALAAAAEEPPALVLFELELPDMSGYELCRALRQNHGDGLPLFLMSGDRTDSMDRVAGLLIGADDYIVKPFNVDELVARVRRFVDRRERTRYSAPPAGMDVTPRELEVLRLLGEGNDQNEIAHELSISPKTVATHIQRLLTKFGARSRAQLVALAYRAGVFSQG